MAAGKRRPFLFASLTQGIINNRIYYLSFHLVLVQALSDLLGVHIVDSFLISVIWKMRMRVFF